MCPSLSRRERRGSILSGVLSRRFSRDHIATLTTSGVKQDEPLEGHHHLSSAALRVKLKVNKKNGKKGNNSLGVIMIIQFTLAEREEIERNKKSGGE